jgi:hypothetical protein
MIGAEWSRVARPFPSATNVGKALSSTPLHRDDRAGPASRMRGASNFAAACVFATLHSNHEKIGTSTPRCRGRSAVL